MNGNNIIFDSFGAENILKEIKRFIGNKNIITNIYRIQEYDSIIFGYFCIGFIDFMFKGKSSLNYTNLFSLNEYKKWLNNTKTTSRTKNFKMIKSYWVIFDKYRESKNPKIWYIFKKALVPSMICFYKYWILSIPVFASLLGVPTGIMNSAIGLKTCAIVTEIKCVS